ncbi:MAG: acyl-CoA dehydrogenase, partial [Calditrichaeota bacterium]|nr:acyl-CoA dehydrogenase [Calditrichota bacterium]
KLARQIFRGMLRHGPGLEKRQAFLGRIVDIGAELFAMAATVSKARKVFKEGDRNAVNLAILFCQGARRRIEANFNALWTNDDRAA